MPSFAALFLLIQILSTLAQRHLGKIGFLGISVLGGLVSSASTSAAAANMVGHQQMRAVVASEGVVLASVASALINLPILYRNVKNPGLLKRLSVFTGNRGGGWRRVAGAAGIPMADEKVAAMRMQVEFSHGERLFVAVG